MAYEAGSAIAFYKLDRSDVRAGAAEIRALFAQIKQDGASLGRIAGAAPVLSTPDPQAQIGVQSYIESLRQLGPAANAASAPIQALVADLRASGAAAGQTEEQVNAHIAALSREALAANDVARALELEEAALGIDSQQKADGTAKSLQMSQAQARAAVATRDYAGAIRLLVTELQSQSERTVAVVNAERQLITIDNQATTAAEKASLVAQRQADTAIRVAQQNARAAVATKDYAGALQILNTAQAENAGGGALALASLETQITQLETAGTVTGQFGAHLSSLISPLALVTAGLAAAVSVAKSFGDALHFAGALQEERTAFGGILGDFSKGNAILDEATRRTRVYGFTTKETTDAFRELAPIIRESTSSTKDQAEALARIAVLKPDDPVKALTSAIEGIKAGRIRELSKELGLSKNEQAALTHSVAEGKDAFVALNEVLDQHGITLKVATERTDGLAGAERRQAQAAEDLQVAQAGFAAGPGLALLNQRIKVTNDATDAFGGSVIGLNNVIRDSVGTFNPYLNIISSYNNFVLTAGKNGLIWAGVIKETTPVVVDNTSANQTNGAAIDQAAQAALQASTAQRAYADALELTGVRARAAALASEQKSSADKVAAVDAQTHGIAEGHLAQQAEDAARALLVAGPAGARTAALLAGSSGQVDILTAAYYRLFAAQQSTNKGATQQDAANFRSLELFGKTAGQTTTEIQKQTAADLARSQGIIQNGTALQKVAELQRIYNDAVRQSGANSAQAITANNALVAAQQAAGKTRVSAAQSTALSLQNVEENSGLQLAKTVRENQERLRDAELSFNLSRTRAQEDYAEKRQSLLAHGQRAQADALARDFEKSQRRAAEDNAIATRRTLRNNQEATGDIGNRTDLRTSQIGARAALRGGGGGLPPATLGGGTDGRTAAPTSTPRAIAQLNISGVINMDGKAVGTGVWPTIEILVDDAFAASLNVLNAPGSGQQAVAGAGG